MTKKMIDSKKFTTIDLVKNKESSFGKEIFEKIWETADIRNMTRYYSPHIIVHYKNKTFGIELLKQRITEGYHTYDNLSFIINEAFSIKELIIFMISETGIERDTQKPFILDSVTVARVKNKRLEEIWLYYAAPVNLDKKGNFIPIGKYTDAISGKEYQRMLSIISALTSPYNLSKRELECLVDLLNGYTAKETARRLNLSHRTVESYLNMLKTKLGCLNRQDLKQQILPFGLWL